VIACAVIEGLAVLVFCSAVPILAVGLVIMFLRDG
jgi:hypothetical protein